MKIANILLAGIAGTTAMTLFSYTISESKQKNFKEPKLLGEFAENAVASPQKNKAQMAGWVMHYVVGILFAGAYRIILDYTKAKTSLLNGILYGGISGIPGIIWWDTAFTLHDKPLRTDVKRYYGHLFIAHIIFGIVAFGILRNKKTNVEF